MTDQPKPNGSEDGAEQKKFDGIVKIEMQYDIKTGEFDYRGNLFDEVITTGMIERLRDSLKIRYRTEEVKRIRSKAAAADDGLILPGKEPLQVIH